MECFICFEEIKNRDFIKCKNRSCAIVMCGGCLFSYLQISLNDKKIPTCPNSTCRYYYLISDIRHLPHQSDKSLDLYASCCFSGKRRLLHNAIAYSENVSISSTSRMACSLTPSKIPCAIE